MQALAVFLMMATSAVPPVADRVEFPDVPPSHWASDAINRLGQAGIVEGRPDGTFGGARAMTRYEFGVAVARLFGRGAGWGWSGDGAPPFSDVPAGH